MTASPTGPQPMTIGDVLLADLRPAHGVMADGHRLGEHADLGREPVGEREGE